MRQGLSLEATRRRVARRRSTTGRRPRAACPRSRRGSTPPARRSLEGMAEGAVAAIDRAATELRHVTRAAGIAAATTAAAASSHRARRLGPEEAAAVDPRDDGDARRVRGRLRRPLELTFSRLRGRRLVRRAALDGGDRGGPTRQRGRCGLLQPFRNLGGAGRGEAPFERHGHVVRRREALCGIAIEAAHHHGVEPLDGLHLGSLSMVACGLAGGPHVPHEHARHRRALVARAKQAPADQRLPEHHGRGVQVAAARHRFAAQLLR